MNPLFIIYLLVLHWVGDALLQSGKMAVEKGRSNQVLTDHVLIYCATFYIGLTFLILYGYTAERLWAYIALNGAFHWITDRITSRINGRLWVKGNSTTPPDLHWFFTSVLADQLCHTVTLIITAWWLLR